MAEILLSPGVLARENDNTFLTQQPVQAGAAILGPTAKGPVGIPTVVTSYSDYQNKLGKNKNKIYARKCDIRKIEDNKVVRKFLDENHIQGYTHSPINLGLYYEDELISLMTFGKSRFKKNSNEYELIRFCNKLNYSIVGGSSKLLKHFEKHYQPDNHILMSFSDRRFFEGGMYEKLGFTMDKVLPPSYIYWKDNIIKNRMSCQKHKLNKLLDKFDPNLTEYENMRENGWRRVWDSGNIKWKKGND